MDERTSIVIIGASGGIGKYLAAKLPPPIIGTYYEHPRAGLHHLDVRDEREVQYFANSCHLGKRIVLINAFGITRNAIGHKMQEFEWDEVVDSNLKGVWLACKHFLPLMRANGWGRIINLSSVVGQAGVPGTAAYAASKAGLVGLTKALAVENATRGVTANCISLGYFDAGMIRSVPDDMLETIKAIIPMKQLGNPDNIVYAVNFLIAADYVTGAVIDVNGGLR